MVEARLLAGRYQLDEVVARGGMGVVWRGYDRRLDRPVAVKLVSGDALRDPTAAERFEREARAVARLNHPNVVAVYDFGTDGDDSFLVMELVEGRSVAALLGDGPLPVSQTVTIAAQACAGLAAAHATGVVHRDVKPANVLVTPSGVVKICDFGIARLPYAPGQARLTGTAVAMGSTSYIAPEQVNDEPVDARTDLYGLGCTIFAMLTGKPPFVGDGPLAVVHQHVTEPPPDVRTVRPAVPAALALLVAELLAKSPADRPADAAAVDARLSALFYDPTVAGSAPVAGAEAAGTAAALPAVETPAKPDLPRPVTAVAAGPVEAGGAATEPRRRRGRIWLVAAGSAAVPAIIVASLLATRGDDPAPVTARPGTVPSTAGPSLTVPALTAPASGTAPAPTARPTATTTAAPSPTRTTTAPPAPSPTRGEPVPATDPIVDLRLAIQKQVAADQLEAPAAADLNKRVDDIDKRLDEGDDRDLAKKIKDLRTRLTRLLDEGRCTQTAYDTLSDGVDRVAALIPAAAA
jgi:hypothetical protein